MVDSVEVTPDEIKALRVSLGLSQHDFAVRIGTTAPTIFRWEKGQRHPKGLYAKVLNDLARETESRG